MFDNSMFYKNNTKLKAAGVVQEYTKEQINELMQCMDDPVYFIEKYVKIVHVDKGIIPFRMYDYQKRYVNTIHNNRFSIAKWCRQSGKSTTTIAYFLYLVLFNSDKKLGILANKAATSRELLSRLRLAYENLPLWMQPGVKEWNKGSIELGNGCKVIAASTSSSSIRGESLYAILLDEFAFLHQNLADAFFESTYPVISSGKETRIYIVSTPNGMNHFYRMWNDAIEKRSKFEPVAIDWWEVPGRDDAWKAETVANIGEESFEQEYGGSFLGSSNTLINASTLSAMVFKQPVMDSNKVKIYKTPKKDNIYVLTVDCSEGVGADYSAISVIDITKFPFEQVAIYKDNLVSPLHLPDIIVAIAKEYNDAWLLLEINSSGKQVADIIKFENEYENMFSCSRNEKRRQQLMFGPGKELLPGLRTTKSTKKLGCSNLKHLIENKQLVIYDFDTIQELSMFARKGDTYQAEPGGTDDIVMTLVIFGWLTGQEFFKEMFSGKDIRKKMFSELKEKFDEELPMGIFSSTINSNSTQIVDSSGIVWSEIN